MQGADDFLDASQLFGLHFGRFVQQDDVAEFNLLDDEVFDVFFIQSLACQAVATGKLALQAQGIDYADQAVQAADAVAGIGIAQARDGTECLCDGFGLADAAGFDDDVVETFGAHQFIDLLDEVGLQRATDAAVLQGHEAVVFLSHYAAFLDEVGIDVHLADVVHDDSEADASLVGQDAVHQGSFATAQVSREQQYGNFFLFHVVFYLAVAKISLLD